MNSAVGYGMMGGQRMMDGGLAFGGFGILLVVGFLVAAAVVVGLVIWAIVRKPSVSHSVMHPGIGQAAPSVEDTALAIARERLARGEIDPEQYTAIVSALNSHTSPTG